MTSWAPVDSVYDVVPREFERAYDPFQSAHIFNSSPECCGRNIFMQFHFQVGINGPFPKDEKQASSRNSSCNSVKALNAVPKMR